MRFTRFSAGLAPVALALLATGCSQTPLPVLPAGIRPRAEAIQPDVAAVLFAEIETERAKLVAEQTTEEVACYQRFIVNSCLGEVRARYRPQLNALHQRDNAVRAGQRELLEEERQARMTDQAKQAQADQERAQQRGASAVPQAQRQADLDRRNADRAAAQPGKAAEAQANRTSTEQSHENAVADQAQRAAAAPAERSQYDARQKAAAAHRADLARRAAEPKTKPPVQPLPEKPGPASSPVPIN